MNKKNIKYKNKSFKLDFKFIFVTILGLSVFILMFLVYEIHIPRARIDEEIIVSIPKGASTQKIARILYEQKVIKNKKFFRFYSRIYGYDRDLKAGSFRLNKSYSLTEIINGLMKQNGVAALIRVTIPEGYSIVEIGELLEQKGLLSETEFYDFLENEAFEKFKNKYPFIKFAYSGSLEGYLFPDTYYFGKEDSVEVIVDTFLSLFEERIIPVWRAAEPVQGSPKQRFHFYKIITMASIIQKEAVVAEEMPKISSVFYNRLKRLKPLAADPTIVYALGKSWKKVVTYNDVKIDSPYNTYKNFGFPPTPIASFGVDSFKAALFPVKSEYMFFVANPGGVTHTFTKTYKEHLKAQRKI